MKEESTKEFNKMKLQKKEFKEELKKKELRELNKEEFVGLSKGRIN